MRQPNVVSADLEDDLEDPELIRRVAARDREAFEILYHRHAPRVYRYLMGQIWQREIIEETVNDVMMVVWQTASRFNGTSKVSTWILGIAHFKGLKARAQATKIDPECQDAHLDEAGTGGPDDDITRKELAERMGRALETLPPEQRAVVELTYYHDRSQAEIATIIGCPVNTVKTRMFHARQRLALFFADESINKLRGLENVKPYPTI